jgi:hypothetical protein
MTLQNDISSWHNLRLAYQNASRGKIVIGFLIRSTYPTNYELLEIRRLITQAS